MAIWAVLMIAVGVSSEFVLGLYRHLFDLRWPKQRYPVGGNAVRVIAGRITLLLGILVLFIALIDAL